MPRSMTLRLTTLVGLSQLVILICFGIVGGRVLLFETRDYGRAKDGVTASRLFVMTLDASTRLSWEQAPTNAAIGSDAPLPPQVSTALIAARALTDKEFDAISHQIAASKVPHGVALLSAIEETRRRLSTARASIDELIAQPLASRTDDEIKARFGLLVAVFPLLAPALNAMEETIVQADPKLPGLVMAARVATRLRDWAGQVGAVFTAPLVDHRALNWDEAAFLERLLGRIATLNEQLRLSYSKLSPDPAIEQALDAADQKFFRDGIGLIEKTKLSGRLNGNSGMTPAAFAGLYVPNTESLIDLRKAISTSIERETAGNLDAKWFALAINGSLVVVALVVVVGLSWILQSRVSRPLRALTNVINRLAGGDYSVEIPQAAAKDELGDICNATRSMRDKAMRVASLEHEAASGRAAQCRRKVAVDELARDYSQLSSSALAELIIFAEHMLASAGEMASALELTRRDMGITAHDAEQTSQSLIAVEAASAKLIASVGEISLQVELVAGAVQGAVNEVQATYSAVQLQNTAATRIRSVVDLIERTATRSNLLALNATIEAAHAGESGRGFSVVAHEVKLLASETAQATKHISGQIADIEQNAVQAEAAVRNAVEAVMRVNAVADAIVGAIGEQGRAIVQIGAQVQAIAASTKRTTQAMEDVTRTAERSGLIIDSVEKAARQVTSGTDELRGNLGHFLAALQSG